MKNVSAEIAVADDAGIDTTVDLAQAVTTAFPDKTAANEQVIPKNKHPEKQNQPAIAQAHLEQMRARSSDCF